MKEYQYSIIRRESRNPKRHRKGRGVSQSDLEALKNELEGNNKDTDLIISDIRDSISDLDSLSVSIEDFATSAEDIKKRLAGAEQSISGKLDTSAFDKFKSEDFNGATDRLTTAEQSISGKLDISVFDKFKAEEYKDTTDRLTTAERAISSKLDTSTFDKFKSEDFKSATDRLTTAEGAISSKLDSSSFEDWKTGDYSNRQSDIDKLLAGKQAAGNYALTSELATSQRQAVSEAVKQAGEMDKEIKVGGRNLIRRGDEEKGTIGGYLIYYLHTPIDKAEPFTLSFDLLSVDRPPAKGEFLVIFMYNTRFQTSAYIKYEEGRVRYSCIIETLDREAYDKGFSPNRVYIYPNESYYNPNNPDAGGFTIANIKLERGTVSTDWTPAPEDVAESISTVNTSLTALASTLLDPTTGEIHKLTTQLESHKKSTDKNFDDLATHPLTIDKDGYWRVWSVKDNQYVTTQYKSRGEDGQDAGRYLGRAKRIHPDFNGNYLLETEDSWRTAKEGDYVYLVGDLSNRGGDKDTYYIVREHKSNTVWDEYDIKGHTPVFSLDNEYRLLADNQLVSQYSLKPSPEEVVGTSAFAERLSAKIDESEKIKTLETGVGDAKRNAYNSLRAAQEIERRSGVLYEKTQKDIGTLTTGVTDLSGRSLTADQRDEVAYLTSSLPQLTNSNNEKLQALDLQRYITLSRDGDSISAYLASDALTAVLKAGITNFGTPEEKENVAINHNGTGHFGNLYFEGNQIDFRTDQKTDPYLSIGAAEADFIENFLYSARVDNTPVSISSTTLPDRNKLPDSSAYTLARTLSVANEGTRLTISIDSLKVETYKPNKAYIVLDGVVLDTWQGHISTGIARLPDGTVEANTTPVPYTASNLIYERTLSKGTHMIQIILESPNSSDKVTLSGVKVRQRYDTGLQQSLLTKSGLRLYGSPQRYLDVDYRQQYYNTAPGTALAWITNDYTLRVKGGAKVDKLTADELDMPGVPLCGATFNESGGCINSFGERAKQQGGSVVQAYRAYNADFYRVYHSIGHTNYIPVLQVYGLYNNNHTQCLTTRIDAIDANSFAVRIVTTGNVSVKHSFSYVAFKTTE